MGKIDEILKEYYNNPISIPEGTDKAIQATIYNYKNVQERRKKFSFATVIPTICLILGLTGICIASSIIGQTDEGIIDEQIIDAHGKIHELIADSESYNIYYDECYNLYYGIIESYDIYLKYNEKIEDFPVMTEKDFEKNFMVTIMWNRKKNPDEKNIMIESVRKEKDNTIICLNTKNDNNESGNVLCAISSKTELSENYIIENEIIKRIESEDIEDLRTEYYSQIQAKKDGCIIIFNGKVQSGNGQKIIDFFDNLSNPNNPLRIYKINYYNEESKFNYEHLIDIIYRDGFFYVMTYDINKNLELKRIESYETIEKYGNIYEGWSDNYTTGGKELFQIKE